MTRNETSRRSRPPAWLFYPACALAALIQGALGIYSLGTGQTIGFVNLLLAAVLCWAIWGYGHV